MQNNIGNILMQMMSGSAGGMNPMQLMNMLQNNPLMPRAKEMANGKNNQQMEEMCRNMCSQKGIDFEQLKSMAQQFGLKL